MIILPSSLNETILNIHTEFVVLVLRHGKIEAFFNLISKIPKENNQNQDDKSNLKTFSRIVPLQTKQNVNDHNWHTVQIIG